MKRVFLVSVIFLFAMCFASNKSYAEGSWTGNVNFLYGLKSLDSDDWTVNSDELIFYEGTLPNGEEFVITMADFIGEDKVLVSVDKETEYGINVDFGPKSWPVCFAVGYMREGDDDSWSSSFTRQIWVSYDGVNFSPLDATYTYRAKLEASTQELRLGVKKIFEMTAALRPYVAGGLAKVSAEVDLSYSEGMEFVDSMFGPQSHEELFHNEYSDSAIGYWLSGGVYWTFAEQFNVGIEVSYSKANIDFGDGMEAEAGGFHYGLFTGFQW